MKYLKTLIIILTIPVTIFSQGGSVYTRYGLGDVSYSSSPRSTGMGDFNIALFDRGSISTSNPASWSRINFTRLQASADFRGIGISGESSNAFYSTMQFSGLLMAVPIEREKGIVMALGLVPVSKVRYEISDKPASADVTYYNSYQGVGGLSKAFVGASYTFPFDVTIGASLDYYTGSISHYSNITFLNNSGYVNTSYRRTYDISGLGGTFGVISSNLSQYLGIKSITNFRIGLTYSTTGKFHSDSTLMANSYTGTVTLSSSGVRASYPDLFAAGLSVGISRNYNLTLNYLYQPWSNYEYNGHNYSYLRNVNKVGAGFEYRNSEPSPNSFWDLIALWAGASYEQSQYYLNNNGINEYAVHCGISIPIDLANTIDFGLKYGVRGTRDNNLLKEKIISFNVGLCLGEPWFIR